ncbi:MAG: AraC family transcriptional regulator [Solirubrobacteraceae bacterium]|jgi:AraC-like DNA-binding protein|nr:AraC family transcriptional regulator [Solirubrobacteraceae bacterium]
MAQVCAHPSRRPDHRETTSQYLAELYLRATTAVERRYRHELTVSALARALATSPRQLQRAYDEIGLTSFAAQLRAVRLRNAAELLAHQSLTVTDVSRLVGYRQPSHFVKAFRRRYGVTPGAFRRRHHHRRRRHAARAALPAFATLPARRTGRVEIGAHHAAKGTRLAAHDDPHGPNSDDPPAERSMPNSLLA